MRVLIVEDNRDTVDLIRAILKSCKWEMQDCDTIEEAFSINESFEPNVILLDLSLRDSNRTQTLDAITRLCDRALVVLTGECDSKTIAEAFKNGADDCLSKDCFTDHRQFIATIRTAWERFTRRHSLTQKEGVIGAQIGQAERDILAQVPNHSQRIQTLEQNVFFASDSIKSTLAVVVSKVEEMSSQAKLRTYFTIGVLAVNSIITIIGAVTHTKLDPVSVPPSIEDHR